MPGEWADAGKALRAPSSESAQTTRYSLRSVFSSCQRCPTAGVSSNSSTQIQFRTTTARKRTPSSCASYRKRRRRSRANRSPPTGPKSCSRRARACRKGPIVRNRVRIVEASAHMIEVSPRLDKCNKEIPPPRHDHHLIPLRPSFPFAFPWCNQIVFGKCN